MKWHSFDDGMELGKAQGKIVFVFFWADWCTYCHTMDRETFHNQTVVDLLDRNFIAVKVDSDREQKLSNLFRIRGLPDNWFFSKSGSVLGHRPGYIPADTFIKIGISTVISPPPNRRRWQPGCKRMASCETVSTASR